ncbi:MAG: hypothetical protein AVDCRST_MAG35-353, partial [uncultured Quadrisphaera sp.]
MGGSGLLLLGVVLLWAFGAVPYWVRRREQLCEAHAEETPVDELHLLEPRRAVAGDRGASSGGLLARREHGAAAPRREARAAAGRA